MIGKEQVEKTRYKEKVHLFGNKETIVSEIPCHLISDLHE